MDPLTIAATAFGLIQVAWSAAKNAGLVGSPEWTKYLDAGLYVAQKATQVIGEIRSGAAEYDTLTVEQIRALLTPVDWDEIEARAKAELDKEE